MESAHNSLPTRRAFSSAVAAFMIVPRHVLGGKGYVAPSDKVTVASIGLGRQGLAITMELLSRPDVQVIAVCDCNKESKNYVEYSPNALLEAERELLGTGYQNWGADLASPGERTLGTFTSSVGAGGREPARRLVEAYYGRDKKSGYRGCGVYSDYRELLDKQEGLDGVYVATPDHWHAPISIAAMKKRKHVLCQKPMTHTIGEAKRVADVAREMGVTAAITVNNPSTPETAAIASWIKDGAIGKVQEVHNWSSRPFWPQGVARPTTVDPIPEGFDWNMWLGPAPERPFSSQYLPFVWRGWYDFGCGSFGDMGCYSFAGVFKVLDLTPPEWVECSSSHNYAETYPLASIVRLKFRANGSRGPVLMSWYDGGLMPSRPAGVTKEDEKLFEQDSEGVMYSGDRGFILGGFNGQHPRVYPPNDKYKAPKASGEAGDEKHDPAVLQWIASCKGGPKPLASFETQSSVTEAFLLGCLAQRLPWRRFAWDATAKRTDSEEANRYIDPPYRPGLV